MATEIGEVVNQLEKIDRAIERREGWLENLRQNHAPWLKSTYTKRKKHEAALEELEAEREQTDARIRELALEP